jgi:hypothetical protein
MLCHENSRGPFIVCKRLWHYIMGNRSLSLIKFFTIPSNVEKHFEHLNFDFEFQ